MVSGVNRAEGLFQVRKNPDMHLLALHAFIWLVYKRSLQDLVVLSKLLGEEASRILLFCALGWSGFSF